MIDELIEKGHIIKTMPDLEKTKRSLLMAQHFIEEAKEQVEMGMYDTSLVASYTAMFHTARALMFKDGFKERNHYAIYLYIKNSYIDKIEVKYINELNILRSVRHKILYGDENVNIREVQEEEADSAIKIALGFLNVVKKLITNNKK